ncbi:Bromodomain-containing protein [Tribonema minus]|uniref:Bromodomain-containing protein n=1 Tax=Tribonema minus TaxID=303371 RepID=A0A836CA18_9STRA|nr:Bromodomain-containing protein [Tribonema minus]
MPGKEPSQAAKQAAEQQECQQQRLHLITPEAELAAAEEPTANAADLPALASLAHFEKQLRAMPLPHPIDMAHFLPPALLPLLRAKWRVVQAEKANFAELLASEPPAPQPRKKVPFTEAAMRRSFFIRRREGGAPSPATVGGSMPFPTTGGRPITARRLRRPARITGEMTPDDVSDALTPLHQRLTRMSFGKAWGNPFTQVITPETAAALRVPNYFNFVKEPMNLTWMRDKLRGAEYAAIADYVADIALVRANAQRYNRPGDPVYGFADTLYDVCAQELAQLGYIAPPRPQQ